MKAKLMIPLLLVLIGCSTGNKPLTEAQKEAVKKEGIPVVKNFYDALIDNDTAKLLSLMDLNSQVVVLNNEGFLNYDEMKKSIRQFFPKVEKQTFETKNEKYIVIDPACFIYSWYGKNEVFMKDGGAPVVYDDLLGTYTFKKADGKWKIFYMHESTKAPEVSDPVKEFTKIEEEWLNALINKDAKVLDRIYASEYEYIDSRGNVYNKQEDISEITGPKYKAFAPFELRDLKVKMYGTVSVVNGVVTLKSTLNGKDISGTRYFTDIFVYRDGRWQCTSTQSVTKAG